MRGDVDRRPLAGQASQPVQPSQRSHKGGIEAAVNTTRRRSKKACTSCRARKVRCDVWRVAPCTNCQHDNTECFVPARKRRTLPAEKAGPSHRSQQPDTTASTTTTLTRHGPVAATEQNPAIAPKNPNAGSSGAAEPQHFNGTATLQPVSQYDQPVFPDNGAARMVNNADLGPDFHDYGGGSEDVFGLAPVPASSIDYITGLENIPDWTFNPEFLGELEHLSRLDGFSPASLGSGFLPSVTQDAANSTWHLLVNPSDLTDIPAEDVHFLHSKGCLHVPNRLIFDEFMSAYFCWVHPTIPVVLESEFWSLCLDSDNLFDVNSYSLFLVQAMLFAGCAFAPEDVVLRCGFSSIREARHSFYRRAKLLFDLDTEKDPYYLSCGSLLLAYHAPNKNERQVNSFWLEEAIRSARIAGAHREVGDPAQPGNHSTKLKRLWWSLVFRDRILPIGVRRPLQISAEYFSTDPNSKISVEDFQQDLGKSRVYSSSTQKKLFQIFALSCRLAEILTELITQIYPVRKAPVLLPIQDLEFFKSTEKLVHVKLRLDEWLEATTFQFTPPFCVGAYEESIAVFANLLFMYHDGAMLAIYNEMAFLWHFRTGIEESLRESKIDGINREIIRINTSLTHKVQELVQAKLIKYLPVSICAFLMLPMMLHIFGLKSAPTAIKVALRRRQFEIHMETMRMQRVLFDGTDFVVQYIEDFAKFIDRIGPLRRPIVKADGTTSEQSDDSRAIEQQHHSLGSWEDLLPAFPALYLRFVMHLDTTLNTGTYPAESALPIQLQLATLGISDS